VLAATVGQTPRPAKTEHFGFAAGAGDADGEAWQQRRRTSGTLCDRETEGGTLRVALCGRWRLLEARPAFQELVTSAVPQRLVFAADGVQAWDASLPLFLVEALRWAQGQWRGGGPLAAAGRDARHGGAGGGDRLRIPRRRWSVPA
jgi:hypothetical protein